MVEWSSGLRAVTPMVGMRAASLFPRCLRDRYELTLAGDERKESKDLSILYYQAHGARNDDAVFEIA